MPDAALSRIIKDKARALGFNVVGITTPKSKIQDYESLQSYIKNNFHGTMNYLSETAEMRSDIVRLFPSAKSVILTLSSYFPHVKTNASSYKISAYSFGNDYHYIIKKKLQELLLFIQSQKKDAEGFVFCDSSAVFEKSYAVDAGLGWIGKNSLLIHPELGSFVFIGGIALNISLEQDKPIEMKCPDGCTKCMNACPVNALVKPYVINASKCISYLTVEDKDEKMPSVNPSSYICGCDICQQTCPYNQKSLEKFNRWFEPQPYVFWNNETWEKLGSADFKKAFNNSVFKRMGLRTLRRNIINIK
jgi:epoxyqueuosine reductase